MRENEPRSPGAEANVQFVANMRTEHPELQDQIPVGCKDCSTAWLHASHGNSDRLQECQGRFEETISNQAADMAKFAVMLCHIP